MIFEKKIIEQYKSMAFCRCDDNGTAYYFSANDFEGLNSLPYSFVSSMGNRLQGYFYSYNAPIKDRLIIFDHGMGGGHRSYMREIEMLCKGGYRVFAYDHTGCMESEGENTNGMTQSLHDLDDCICALRDSGELDGVRLSVMGHSWGAFATMNIPKIHSEVSSIVAISGFVSAERLIDTFFEGLLSVYRKPIIKLEREANSKYFDYYAPDSIKTSGAKALLIYSKDDPVCKKTPHYDVLEQAFCESDNVTMLLVDKKGHNPNYTEDAAKYLSEYVAKRTEETKAKRLSTEEERRNFVESFDWKRMTEQDDEIWNKIFEFLR